MQELNIYGLWGGKQTAKGTKNATPGHRLVQVAGDFNLARDDGSENYSDLTKYGASTDWVNSLLGNGTPAIEATPAELAWLLWMFHGAETVTAVTGPPTAQKHSFVPAAGIGWWGSYVRRIGLVDLDRHSYNDSLITQMQIEGSTANKAVRVTPSIISLDPGEVIAADPAQAMPADKPFLFTDGASAFTIDGVVIRAHSQFTLVINDTTAPLWGDDVTALDVAPSGQPVVTLGVTLLMNSEARAEFNRLVYGSAAPVAGTKPLKGVPALGSYSFWLKQRDATGALNGREFHTTIPGVKWAIPDAPGPNPDGGTGELALAGAMRPVAGQSPYTIDVNTDNTTVAFVA